MPFITSSISTQNKAWAVILAAGEGRRLGGACPKQFLSWRSKPLYWHSARAFSACACIEGLVFAFPAEYLERESRWLRSLGSDLGLPWHAITGGATRQESSRLALKAIPQNASKVLIHDAARPFLTPELIWRVCSAITSQSPNIAPAIPVNDTIKLVCENSPSLVEATLPRHRLAAIQTPQGFSAPLLREAHAKAAAQGYEATDDAALLEYVGHPVELVEGLRANLKITTPDDLERLMETDPRLPCSGFGYDVHRFGQERPLRLGGVEIPSPTGILAHSDGDVLLHALIDAILGCACLGDIGQHFPDSDPTLEGINSAILLDQALTLAKKAGVEILQADITIVAQKPKLAPWREQIRRNVASLLGLPKERVNVKATTEEGLGFTGAQEGIKAFALVNGWRNLPITTVADQ